MNKNLTTLLSTTVAGCVLFCSAANAQDNSEASASAPTEAAASASVSNSTLDADWSFGLQAAPLLFGLSLRHNFDNKWQVQGVLTPGDNAGVGLRVLRTSTQKRFWQSYLFGGIATVNDTSYIYSSASDDYQDYRKTAVTVGLGVEWAWAAKNPSLPPLSWSLELGLGLADESYDNPSIEADDASSFLAAGVGIHYQFE